MFNYFRNERRKDRELLLAVVREITSQQSALLLEHLKVIREILSILSPGETRTWTNTDAIEAAREREEWK